MSKKPTYDELDKRIRELESAESEHKKIIETLLKKEKRYRNLFDQMLHEIHVWKLVFDDNGNIKT